MQIELKTIAEYRKEYKVYALFEGSDRRFADIVRNEHAEGPIDAYIIMINPGSCHKKSDVNPVIDTAFYKGFSMVEAVSDPAQKETIVTENLAMMDAFLMKYAEESGYTTAGLARECYIDGIWNKESEEDWLTEIQLPIA